MEAEKLGRKLAGALIILKKFHLHKCGHEGKPISGADCFLSMIDKENANHYFIASQDCDLQKKLRHIPGVPLLYLHQKTPVLEHPSDVSTARIHSTIGLDDGQKQIITELKEKHGIIDEVMSNKKKRKKKGPNPLSCKKKKKGVPVSSNLKKKEITDKKIRKKVRIPKHVKDELLKSIN